MYYVTLYCYKLLWFYFFAFISVLGPKMNRLVSYKWNRKNNEIKKKYKLYFSL